MFQYSTWSLKYRHWYKSYTIKNFSVNTNDLILTLN